MWESKISVGRDQNKFAFRWCAYGQQQTKVPLEVHFKFSLKYWKRSALITGIELTLKY